MTIISYKLFKYSIKRLKFSSGPERVKLNAKRAAERAKIEAFSRPGAHPRELNPYWRDGGTGLPPERESAIEASAPSSSSGLCFLAFLLIFT